MNLIGVPAGDPYQPFAPLTREETAALGSFLRTTVLAHRLERIAAA